MEGTTTSSSSTATTPRKSDDKPGGLFSCCGRIRMKFRWVKVRRSDGKHYKNLKKGGNFDCKSFASVAVAPRQPRLVGEFRYDPMSYSQNFDEGCWYDEEEGYAGRSFSSRFASLPSKTMRVDTSTMTTATMRSSDWD